MYRVLILLILLTSTLKCLRAQDTVNNQGYHYGVSLFFGLGDNSSTYGELGNIWALEVGYKHNAVMFSRCFNGEFLSFKSPVEKAISYCLLYGYSEKKKYISYAGFIGCGLLEQTQRGNFIYSSGMFGGHYERIEINSICAELNLKILVHVKGIGVGFIAQGNINKAESYAAYYLFLQGGWYW